MIFPNHCAMSISQLTLLKVKGQSADFITYFMVNHTKTYASLVSTLPKTISIKWRRKGGDLSPKSCCFQSKQPCANTMNRFTNNSFIDTENVKHFQHFKNLSIFVDDEKATQGKTVVSPQQSVFIT